MSTPRGNTRRSRHFGKGLTRRANRRILLRDAKGRPACVSAIMRSEDSMDREMIQARANSLGKVTPWLRSMGQASEYMRGKKVAQ